MNKSRHVTFRCTQDQYDEIKWQAKYAESTLSDYILNNLCPELKEVSGIRPCSDEETEWYKKQVAKGLKQMETDALVNAMSGIKDKS